MSSGQCFTALVSASPPEPVPLRIGDAERDQAAEYLRNHLAEGRLDRLEFDERLTQALSARTADDLTPLFSDLPGPKPGTDVAYRPPWLTEDIARSGAVVRPPAAPAQAMVKKAAKALGILSAVAWPLVILLLFAIDDWDHYWWLIFIPIALSSIAGSLPGRRA
jgi:hypothetical protein